MVDGHYKNLLYYYLLESVATTFSWGWGVGVGGGPYLFLFLVGLPGLADLLLPLLQLPLLPLTLVLALVFHNLLGLPHIHTTCWVLTHVRVLDRDTVSVLGPDAGQCTGS